MHQRPVFYDASGRRRLWLSLAAVVSLLSFAGLLAAFFLSLAFRPELPSSVGFSKGRILPVANHHPGVAYRAARQELIREVERSARHHVPTVKKEVSLGFFAPWEETGIASFRAHVDHMTHVAPQWLRLDSAGRLDTRDADLSKGSANAELVATAKSRHVHILPILTNATRDGFSTQLGHRALSNPTHEQALVDQVVQFVSKNDFDGVNLDFEALEPEDTRELGGFIARLKQGLGAGREVTVDVPADADPDYLREVQAAADWVVLMAYDQHTEGDSPGPIAATPWVQKQIDLALAEIPPEKLVLGLGSYAYDWPENGKPGESLTYQEALANAKTFTDHTPSSQVVDFDADALNATYRYRSESGVDHEVWMLDAASDYNAVREGRLRRVRGYGLWALGMEDPGVWQFLGSPPSKSVPDMGRIAFPYEVEHSGKGEILRVQSRPSSGEREVDVDAATGLITDENYTAFPSPYVVSHSGYRPKTLAITFDDGPDPKFTPQILATLKDLGVPATFFVIGQNAEENPDIVRQEVAEGHEVGGHSFFHPNLGLVDSNRVNLEMNATQRAIQSITGRSSILFRPPYNADSEPRSPEEVKPVDEADQLGYVTVGEKVDPNDWKLTETTPTGEHVKSGRDIANLVETQIEGFERSGNEGNVILLHDGGGDRTQTIAALKLMVPELKRKGYRFVLPSDLMGKKMDEVMPPLAPSDRALILADGFVFGSWFGVAGALQGLFLFALVLGFAKVFLVLGLAIRQWMHEKREPTAGMLSPSGMHRVTVAIAAYNEERVIERTIRSVLASDYPIAEVLVVDDGSSDGTASVVKALAVELPQVRLISQPNGGKASALNHALESVQTDWVVFLDADTLLDKGAIGLLCRKFDSSQVAAVAGNVKVGNPQTLMGLWQSLEYTSSQNLDRRAYAQLNAVTVVPGAIGAWRVDVIRRLGGFQSDTLAEDMDLTWRTLEAGYEIRNEPEAMAFTEVPDSVSAFVKQRFRWAFGTLQCLAKHRRLLRQRSWFSWLVLPCIAIFQFGFQLLAPVIDLQVLVTLLRWIGSYASRFQTEDSYAAYQGSSLTLGLSLGLAALFLVFEMGAAWLAYRMERQRPERLEALLLQRLIYRQLLYFVAVRAVFRAMVGHRQGWNKLDRKGTAQMTNP